jgi:hypothetical protein
MFVKKYGDKEMAVLFRARGVSLERDARRTRRRDVMQTFLHRNLSGFTVFTVVRVPEFPGLYKAFKNISAFRSNS